jgi:hypothetical protein
MENDISAPGSVERVFSSLRVLPPGALRSVPVLADLAFLHTGDKAHGIADDNAGISETSAASGGLIRRRLERRYLRIRFVQEELGKLDFKKAKPGAGFEDFVFAAVDFSVYREIPRQDFALFSEAGLADYGDSFFEGSFRLKRKAVLGIIRGAYREAGSSFIIKDEKLLNNSLVRSIMRSFHCSLDFAPLFDREEILRECACLLRFPEEPAAGAVFSPPLWGIDAFFAGLVRSLHGAVIIHRDGMWTELRAEDGAGSAGGSLVLKGTFYPHGKAYTIPLVNIDKRE